MTKNTTEIISSPVSTKPFHHQMNPFEIFSEGITRLFSKYTIPTVVLIALSVIASVFTQFDIGIPGESIEINAKTFYIPVAISLASSFLWSTAAMVLGRLSTQEERVSHSSVLVMILETLPWAILKGLALSLIVIGLVIIGPITLFIPLIIFLIRGNYSYYIMVAEKKGVMESIREAMALTKHRKMEAIAIQIINGFVSSFVGPTLTYAVEARHLELLREISASGQNPPTHKGSKILFGIWLGLMGLFVLVFAGIVFAIIATSSDSLNNINLK